MGVVEACCLGMVGGETGVTVSWPVKSVKLIVYWWDFVVLGTKVMEGAGSSVAVLCVLGLDGMMVKVTPLVVSVIDMEKGTERGCR